MIDENSKTSEAVGNGVGVGAVLAMIISYTANHNIWWALLHGLLGWLYVIYRLAVGMP